jgi:hypothetical protein
MSMSDPQQDPTQGRRTRSVSAKSVIAQAIGGVFVILGVLVWWTIFPRTLYSFEAYGIELGIISGYIITFGFLYLIGTLLFVGGLGKKNPVARTIAIIGVVLLITIVVTASMHGRPT